jgi:fumarylpyruvate hydrolase
MSSLLFSPPNPIVLPIAGSTTYYPVGRVFCVGRNYAAHAREMGASVDPANFFYFTKWASSVVPGGDIAGGDLPFPPNSQNVHFEGELVLALNGSGHALTLEQADALIYGYACGLDITRRDLQNTMKAQGWPWDIGKNFEYAAPVGALHPRAQIGTLGPDTILETWVNGTQRQNAEIGSMLWSPAEIVARISRSYTLAPGDLIFTGTPEGVGALGPGDQVEVRIGALTPLAIRYQIA